MASGKFVAYYRVSTKGQGVSGLGLDAQREAVRNYLNGGNWQLVAEFTEVESGKSADNRPQLQAALRACKLHRATMVIAKLDRLSRNAAFLMGLKDAGTEFVAADMPSANRMTVGVMALVAQQEAEAISARTKAALAVVKSQGVKLGNPQNLKNRKLGSERGAGTRAARADERAALVLPIIAELRAAGLVTLRELAAELNARGIPAARGGEWSSVAVMRALARA